jgi:hypothetical protein
MKNDGALARSHDIATKVALLFKERAEFAREHFTQRLGEATEGTVGTNPARLVQLRGGRLVTLVQRLLADERVQRARPTSEQLIMIENIGQALSASGNGASHRRAPRKAVGTRKATRKSTARARS